MHANGNNTKFKGVRRRKWGKWVSEIRVPGTQERLWLGTYATPEAAAVAHDVAVYCLRRPSKLDKLNFPDTLFSYCSVLDHHAHMSPRSVQEVASRAAMDVDARNIDAAKTTETTYENEKRIDDNVVVAIDDSNVVSWDQYGTSWQGEGDHELSVSIEDYL
ncbi:hypothetical protein RJT34_05242 [Clitoria ternatea]|uniref:AP2/ERF domain-containing protein n=1 Tax=Clitoria ternatea TaxID=43366 RepID=A0AAN9K2V3_CLITE